MTIPAWTFSQLDSFETCPRKYYLIRVAKAVKDPPNEYNKWGDEVHKALEYRIKDGTPLPEGMTQWEPLMAKIDRMPGVKVTEREFSLDRNFQPTDWKDAWTRGKADLDITHGTKGAVYDYKTGKRKLTDQLKLYAAYKMCYSPELEQVTTGFVWLKDKKVDIEVVTREELPAIWQKFMPTVRKLESAYERDAWPPRPNGLCKNYCPCTGCEFHGKR